MPRVRRSSGGLASPAGGIKRTAARRCTMAHIGAIPRGARTFLSALGDFDLRKLRNVGGASVPPRGLGGRQECRRSLPYTLLRIRALGWGPPFQSERHFGLF